MRRPAILGGVPSFPDGLPFARPATPSLQRFAARLAPSWDRGILTNGPLVRQLEKEAADRLGVPHVLAVASCTSGLLLTLRALGIEGRVVLPSFTFSASAHAIAWNGLRPVFAECDPASFQLDPADLGRRLAGCGAVLATHVFGAPCDIEEIAGMAAQVGVPVVYDAAHAFGATRRGVPVGRFGDAEVFSMSPTKPIVAGEGGLVATCRDDVAEAVRIGRDYGNPGNYDTRFVGLNARLSEMHAALALESMAMLDETLDRRRELDHLYRERLVDVPGVATQRVAEGDESACKDFTVAVDPEVFGLDRDLLAAALLLEGIDTRRYFDPPVHRQRSYRSLEPSVLPVTDDIARRVLSLPLSGVLEPAAVDGVVDVIEALHAHAGEVAHAAAG